MMFTKKRALARICWASLGIALLGAGCGSDDNGNGDVGSNDSPSETQQADLHSLYNTDVAAMSTTDESALQSFDYGHDNYISKIFGAPTAAAITEYYNERVHYAFTIDDLNAGSMTPSNFQFQGWMTPASSSGSSQSTTHTNFSDSNIQIGALNISTLFWLDGITNDTTVVLNVAGNSIPIDSSRTGVIMLGPGYTATQSASDGQVFNIPASYREAILLHEARHSDCTDGLSQAEISAMRSAKSSEEFFAQYPRQRCGHTHIVCTSGTYAGIAACDSERFGAYTVGAFYLAAVANSEPDEISRKIDAITALDYLSRYVDVGNEDAEENSPNMTSSGVL